MPYRAFESTPGEPDVVNEVGTKFWLELGLTDYANKKLNNKFKVCLVEDTIGHKEFVLIEYNYNKANGIYRYADQSYEGMATAIDMIRISEIVPGLN